MKQHPVPQQISAYEFRLVGDMTLKQFFQLAGGVIVALVIYASGLPAFVKWPLIFFFAFLGIALAFLPVEERPLSSWIVSFFRAIYSPTRYEWVAGAAEDVFAQTPQEAKILAPEGQEKAERYLKSIPLPKVLSVFEEAEQAFFKNVQALFHSTPAQVTSEEPTPSPPSPIPRVEEVPVAPPVRVEHQPRPEPTKQQPAYTPQRISPILTGQAPTKAVGAKFTPEAAPPSPPEVPNTVVGQVLTGEGKIVEGAILEIKNAAGQPVRALKSNKIGHFMAVTPLPDGEYRIETEKEGYSFDTIEFRAEGKIIPPIEIRGKAAN